MLNNRKSCIQTNYDGESDVLQYFGNVRHDSVDPDASADFLNVTKRIRLYC